MDNWDMSGGDQDAPQGLAGGVASCSSWVLSVCFIINLFMLTKTKMESNLG